MNADRTALLSEIQAIVDRKMAAGEAVAATWLVQEIATSHREAAHRERLGST